MIFSRFDHYFFVGLSLIQYKYNKNTVDFWTENKLAITLGNSYYQYHFLTNILTEHGKIIS